MSKMFKSLIGIFSCYSSKNKEPLKPLSSLSLPRLHSLTHRASFTSIHWSRVLQMGKPSKMSQGTSFSELENSVKYNLPCDKGRGKPWVSGENLAQPWVEWNLRKIQLSGEESKDLRRGKWKCKDPKMKQFNQHHCPSADYTVTKVMGTGRGHGGGGSE